MPDPSTLVAFVLAAAVLVAIPGPAVLYIVSAGLGRGRRAAMASALGIETGAVVHVLAAALGLSALLARSVVAYSVVKYLGAAYLIYLGVKTLRSRGDALELSPVAGFGPGAFRRGVLVNTFNPKVALFFLAFLPQFVDPARGSVAAQTVMLGLIFITVATVIDMAYAVASGAIGRLLLRRPRVLAARRRVNGLTLLALGASAAATDNR